MESSRRLSRNRRVKHIWKLPDRRHPAGMKRRKEMAALCGRDRPSARPLVEPAVAEHAVECDGAVDVRFVTERPGHVLGTECFEIGDGQRRGALQAGDDQLAEHGWG